MAVPFGWGAALARAVGTSTFRRARVGAQSPGSRTRTPTRRIDPYPPQLRSGYPTHHPNPPARARATSTGRACFFVGRFFNGLHQRVCCGVLRVFASPPFPPSIGVCWLSPKLSVASQCRSQLGFPPARVGTLAGRCRFACPFVWRVTTRKADAPLTGEAPSVSRIVG